MVMVSVCRSLYNMCPLACEHHTVPEKRHNGLNVYLVCEFILVSASNLSFFILGKDYLRSSEMKKLGNIII